MAKPGPTETAGEGPQLRPLHGGRHNLPRDVVAFNQRERMLAAVASVVAGQGYNKMTVAHVTEVASVSRRVFYEHFSDKEDAFLAAYDAVDSHLASLLAEAAEERSDWPEQVAAVLVELTRFFAAHVDVARLYLVEAAVVGEGTVERREQSTERLIALLSEGREQRVEGRGLSPGIEEGLVGGVMTMLARRVVAEAEQLERFAPAAIEFVLTPYLGPTEARRFACGEV
ncbi:MAG TPA: TetR/AcrR family transcriptional regulator [Solirubrobacterales bacterium]